MRDIDLNSVKPEDLVDVEGLKSAFVQYARKVLKLGKFDAEMAAMDFNNPYNTQYVIQDYEGDYEIGDATYEIRHCRTDFNYCGMFEWSSKKPFEFYMLFDKETLPDNKVQSYIESKKMFIV